MPTRLIQDQARRSLTLHALSDAAERGWWRLTTMADDYGRFPADPTLLLHRLMEYETPPTGWTRTRMARVLGEWERVDLIHVYQNGADARLYGHILTFREYQRERESQPKFPDPPCRGQRELAAKCRESRQVAALSEGRSSKTEVRGSIEPSPSFPPPNQASWGTAEALVALYNASAPDECPAVEKLSPGRREKARRYLAAFPDRDFWEQTFQEIRRSRFLRGLVKQEGYPSIARGFDWLLTKGKDGTENAVKTWEGKYRD